MFASGLPVFAFVSRVAYRGHPRSWRAFIATAWDVHALALVLLFGLAVQFADTHGVTTDGVIYFSQLRSVLYDRDLDVAAEFSFLGQPPRPSHVVPIGPTFVWLPLYAAVAFVDLVTRAVGMAPPLTQAAGAGLTLPFVRAALVSSFAIGSLGLLVLHLHLRRAFDRGVAFAATTVLFAATPLVWYMVYEPAMTHAASFGFVSLFVVVSAALTRVGMSVANSILLGALLGLAVMTRPQEAVFALFPAILLLTAREPLTDRLKAALRLALWALVGISPFLVLQGVHTAVLLSRESFALGGSGGGYLNFFDSHWADTLWSSRHGFFTWTPVAYLAFLAMFAYAIRSTGWAIAAIVIVLLMAWVNGSTADWAGGWSFGGRRFISVLAVLAPGVALIISGLTSRPMVSMSIVAAIAIVWNQLLVAQYARGTLSPTTPISFGQIVRQQFALATSSPFVYPFAFPANALFAWRTGLPIEHFDRLGSERLRAEFDLTMTADATAYLTDGWGSHVTDPFGPLRWIEGDRAEMLLPLDLPLDRVVTVTWTARTRRLDPPQIATLALVINGRETFRFTPDTDHASTFAFTVPPDAGLWMRGYNRVSFERRSGTPPVALYGISIK